MTKCSKEVQELECKFFDTYEDASNNDKFFIEAIDIEGGAYPDQVWSKLMKENYSLRTFTRSNSKDKFIEHIYLKEK